MLGEERATAGATPCAQTEQGDPVRTALMEEDAPVGRLGAGKETQDGTGLDACREVCGSLEEKSEDQKDPKRTGCDREDRRRTVDDQDEPNGDMSAKRVKVCRGVRPEPELSPQFPDMLRRAKSICKGCEEPFARLDWRPGTPPMFHKRGLPRS